MHCLRMTAAASACLGIMPGVACASLHAQVYATVDGGWLVLSASAQRMTARLFRSLDRPELIEDLRFRTNADRLNHVEEPNAIVQDLVGQHTLDANLTFSQQPSSWSGGVRSGRQHGRGETHPILEAHDLAQLGFAMASYPATGFLAVSAVLEHVYKDLLQHGSSGPPADRLMSYEAMHSLMGFDEVWRRDREPGTSAGQ